MPDWPLSDLTPAARFLLDVAWQSTVWLSAAVVLARLLERRPDRAHRVLLFGLAAAFATPVLAAGFRAWGFGVLPPETVATATPLALPPVLAQALDVSQARGFRWDLAVAGAWILASAYLAIRLIVSVLAGRRLLARAQPVEDAGLAGVAGDAAARLGLAEVPRAMASPDIACPMVWCWATKPVILLPAQRPGAPLVPGSTEAAIAVLGHELAHWKRRDHLAALLGECAIALLPWHPLVWTARRRLHDLGEAASDAWVLVAGTPATTYAEALLDLVPTPRHSLALAAVTTRRGLAWRVRRILGDAPATPDRGPAWSILVVLATALLTGSLAAAQRRAADAPDSVVRLHGAAVTAPSIDAPGLPSTAQGVVALPLELDLGAVADGEAGVGTIQLVNVGSEPRRLVRARTTCGCTTLGGFEPTALAPGAVMNIDVAITASGASGAQKTKRVIFHVEGQPPIAVPVTVRVE